jgi:hypothetical protein
MAGVKVTLEFSCDKYSWSEAWWWITAGAATFQNAYGPSVQLAQYRVPLLGVGCQLDRWRLSLFPANRRTFDVFYPSNGGQPSWPADPTGIRYAASRPFTAVLLLLENPSGLQKHTFLAGCPTALSHTVPGDSTGLQFASAPDFLNRLGQFLNFVSSGSWGWLSRADTTMNQVQGLVTNAAFPSMIGLVTGGPIAGLTVGSKVLVKGFARINVKVPALGGLWTVGGVLPPVAPATQWTYFLLNSGAVPVNNYKGLGSVGLLLQDFQTISSGGAESVTERIRGGTLNRPRGRSRTHP